MEVRTTVGAFCIAASILGAAFALQPHRARDEDVRQLIAADADSLDASVIELDAALIPSGNSASDSTQSARARLAFRHARARYKRIEGAIEFYAPPLAATFNSRRAEVDDDDAPPPSTMAPSGFPALEPLLWPSSTAAQRDSARAIVVQMRRAVSRVRAFATAIAPTDAQVVELTRLELVRVSTLGIAGFDAPRTGEAMRESAEALEGVRLLYVAARDRWPFARAERQSLDTRLNEAVHYLRTHTDFVDFDRLRFLADYEEPAARALDSLRRAAHVVPIVMRRGLRADVASAYSANAFDPRAYAPNTAPIPSGALIALGKSLFSEPILSGNARRSCASCHAPNLAFTDGRVRPAGINGRHDVVARNTPTLINAALQPVQLYDERAATLEDQIIDVLRSPTETASSIDIATRRIGAIARYRAQFANAFQGDSGDAVTPLHLRQAIGAYVRTLVSLDSRFDRAVRGDPGQLTAQETQGFNVFMGKAGCGTCHFAPLFNGSAPPLYVGSDVEVIGTPATPRQFSALDADSGRARIDSRPEHLHAFKVPSLRNVAVTAPYMHHGAFATLDQVLRFYDGGGARGAGARIGNQTLAADSLHLTSAERLAIIAFLATLTDTAGVGRQ